MKKTLLFLFHFKRWLMNLKRFSSVYRKASGVLKLIGFQITFLANQTEQL